MICKRCQQIMYGYPHKLPLNHKPGYCSDRGSIKKLLDPRTRHLVSSHQTDLLPWPLPEGLFSDGKIFHSIAFLQTIHILYQQLVEEAISIEYLELELQMFFQLYIHQMVFLDGKHYFKLPDIRIDNLGVLFVIKILGVKYIRVDCLDDN